MSTIVMMEVKPNQMKVSIRVCMSNFLSSEDRLNVLLYLAALRFSHEIFTSN